MATNPLLRLNQTTAAVKPSIIRDVNFIASSSTLRKRVSRAAICKSGRGAEHRAAVRGTFRPRRDIHFF